MGLDERMNEAGRRLGEREAPHADPLEKAAAHARALHAKVRKALVQFHDAASRSGAAHLRVALGEPALDAKHVRAFQFDVSRGRTRAIVVVKSRGEVTLVGPFHAGKPEKPCRTLSLDSEGGIEEAIGDLLERFLEEATQP
ncbi:MAG: hypothetical protein VCB42_01850 [Myxococcota bacterium]